jgi:hypothetical protein
MAPSILRTIGFYLGQSGTVFNIREKLSITIYNLFTSIRDTGSETKQTVCESHAGNRRKMA